MAEHKLRVFLCHASEDKSTVRELYGRLNSEGWLDVWLDEEKLYPGQDWNLEIHKAVRAAQAVIVCISRKSITKEGYVQREMRLAVDAALRMPESTIFIIPLRLEDCDLPSQLDSFQYADYFEQDQERAYQKLLVSLGMRAHSLGINIHPTVGLTPSPADSKKLTPGGHPIYLFGEIEFVKVPKGPFLMGSETRFGTFPFVDTGYPAHTIDIPYEYWIGRFPITNLQYAAFILATGRPHPVIDWEEKRDHPVVNIGWQEALDYVLWINMQVTSLPKGMVFRLPTEAEWEKAARGTDGRAWPWGNNFDLVKCNASSNAVSQLLELLHSKTTPVEKYSPQGDSPYGVADMTGNAWEWTQSLFKPYPYDSKDGREALEVKGAHILRGGSFNEDADGVRVTRRSFIPMVVHEHIGFRIVMAPKIP